VGRTNAIGLRGPLLPEVRTPGVLRILYIGDSTCWGLGVEREQTYPARAAMLAATELDRPVEIVNGCIPGHSSFQARIMLRRLLRFTPDLVVFYLGARNDVDRHRYFRDSEIPARSARKRAAWHGVRVFQATEAAFDGVYKSLLRKPLSLAHRARVSPDEFRKNYHALLEETRDAGVGAIMLMPPWSASLLDRYPLLPEYQQVLLETAQTAGVVAIPLQPEFSPRSEEFVYLEDRLHFSAGGHEIAANQLAPAIVSALDSRGGRLP
jgi:lysophospholipase L1-like esterase